MIYFKGFLPRKIGDDQIRYQWTAWCDPQAAVLHLFVSYWNRSEQKWFCHRGRIPLAAPEKAQFTLSKTCVVTILEVRGKELLCRVIDGLVQRTWGRLSTQTWQTLAKGELKGDWGHFVHSSYSPDGKDIYTVYSQSDWNQEGVDSYIFPSQVTGSQPLYRLFHPGIKKHLWSSDDNEYNVLKSSGWSDEGITGYIIPNN